MIEHRYLITGPCGTAEADTLAAAKVAKATLEREAGVQGARNIIVDRGPNPADTIVVARGGTKGSHHA